MAKHSFRKQDNSPHVEQRDKVKETIAIKENFKWTPNQQKIVDAIISRDSRIILVSGSAGCGKSLLSTYCGLKLLNEKRLSEIFYVRSPLESSDSAGMGYIPGDQNLKFEPYTMILQDKMRELLNSSDIGKLTNDERIVYTPLNYIRGSSWAAKYILCEEVNNFTLSEFKLVLTRYARFSKMVLVGDFDQTDLPKSKQGAFKKVFDTFNTPEAQEKGIHCFSLGKEDILRSEITSYLIDNLNKISV